MLRGGLVQDGSGTFALGGDQWLAVLRHELEERTSPQQIVGTGAQGLRTKKTRNRSALLHFVEQDLSS